MTVLPLAALFAAFLIGNAALWSIRPSNLMWLAGAMALFAMFSVIFMRLITRPPKSG